MFYICGFQGTVCDKSITLIASGDKEIRTLDPLLARQVLSQLSYIPIFCFLLFLDMIYSYPVGLSGLEPPTSRLSGVRSNQLSYKPSCRLQHSIIGRFSLNRRVRDGYGCFPEAHRHRKFRVTDSKCRKYFIRLWKACFPKTL